MPRKKQTQPTPLSERAEKYMAADQKLMQKHKLGKRIVVLFPHSKSIPLVGRLALYLLKRKHAVLDMEFFDINR